MFAACAVDPGAGTVAEGNDLEEVELTDCVDVVLAYVVEVGAWPLVVVVEEAAGSVKPGCELVVGGEIVVDLFVRRKGVERTVNYLK